MTSTPRGSWPSHLPVKQVRIARPTDRLNEVVAFLEVAARLERRGHQPVEPDNPYWKAIGITFEDPDGWRVVLVRRDGFIE